MADERVVPGQTGVLNVMKHIARYNLALQLCQGKRVLDAACGSGYGSKILSMVSREVVGWDIDRSTIDYARKNYGSDHSSFYPVDLNNLGKIDRRTIGGSNSFDTLVCFETLEHLEDPPKFLSEIARFCLPAATIIASLPLNEPQGFNEHHRHRYTLETAKDLFSSVKEMGSFIQREVNFYTPTPHNSTELYTYFIFAGQLTT